ncbi:PCC domain-containing protein [Brevibacterium pigmentatum]|uniref:PCC domain-containing protein n=1 Tax=Brevibacterium pigmentatum TaxID=1496080 RepID=UPI00141FC9CD|nr:PPC domain-containing DNA-binding protein [Brevibacterium pigmentatum]
MSNGAETTALQQPTFPLKAPGTAVVHAGPRQNPRIVSVPTRWTEHVLELPEGADLFNALEASLTDFAVDGIMAEFVSGQFGRIDYVHPAFGPDADHPMSFTEAFSVDNTTELRHASATIGFREGTPFCHVHASWTGADGQTKGGHLLPGTLAGPAGLTIRLFTLHDARLISEVDPETGFSAFAPTPTDRAGDMSETPETPKRSETPDFPDAVISRIRPGEILDEAVLAVCRNVGFDSAEVLASLGSTTGAVFTDGTAPWPAVEFTHLSGTVIGTQGRSPQTNLSGEVVDVAGEVCAGTLKAGANAVAVTFELFVRRLA